MANHQRTQLGTKCVGAALQCVHTRVREQGEHVVDRQRMPRKDLVQAHSARACPLLGLVIFFPLRPPPEESMLGCRV